MWCITINVPRDSALLALRLFGGLLLDIKRKAPFYVSDFKDGCSLQCVASFLFLYCACMSPVITFGGLLGEATEGRIVRMHTQTPASLSLHTPGDNEWGLGPFCPEMHRICPRNRDAGGF